MNSRSKTRKTVVIIMLVGMVVIVVCLFATRPWYIGVSFSIMYLGMVGVLVPNGSVVLNPRKIYKHKNKGRYTKL